MLSDNSPESTQCYSLYTIYRSSYSLLKHINKMVKSDKVYHVNICEKEILFENWMSSFELKAVFLNEI